MQANACLSVCLSVWRRVSIYMFPVCGGPIRVRGHVGCRLLTRMCLCRALEAKKRAELLSTPLPPRGAEVCAFLSLNLRTCVHPLIMGPFDMLHLRRRKTPLCPAPRWGRGLGWSVWCGGIANIGTGLILSAQGQTRRWLNSGGSSREGTGGSKLQWMNF